MTIYLIEVRTLSVCATYQEYTATILCRRLNFKAASFSLNKQNINGYLDASHILWDQNANMSSSSCVLSLKPQEARLFGDSDFILTGCRFCFYVVHLFYSTLSFPPCGVHGLLNPGKRENEYWIFIFQTSLYVLIVQF